MEYGKTDSFSLKTLLRTSESTKRVPFSWYAWLVTDAQKKKNILIDTGFDDEGMQKKWRLSRFVSVPRLLGKLGVRPPEITDVVLTHCHWDHAGNLAPYVNATLWLQESEYTRAMEKVDESHPEKGGIRLQDLAQIKRISKEGRLKLIDGNLEIAPGITLHKGGKHTFGIQWVEIATGGATGKVILASDIAYISENIETTTSSRSTTDGKADEEQIRLMKKIVRDTRLIIPGHDAETMTRFPRVAEHIAEIKGEKGTVLNN